MPEITKLTIVSLIFVRFSIQKQRRKAKKVSFTPRLLDMTLLERQAPLLGRLRYIFIICHLVCLFNILDECTSDEDCGDGLECDMVDMVCVPEEGM